MTGKRHRTTDTHRRGIRLAPTIAAIALAFMLASMLAGCEEPVTGIFHHVAQQDPPVDRNLPNDLAIGGVVRWADRYVVAAGKTWARPVGTADDPGSWTQMTSTYDGDRKEAVLLPLVRWRPSGGDPSLLAGAVFVKEDLSFALLRASEVEAGSIAWSTVDDRKVRGREVVGLFTPDADESVLFVVVTDGRGADRSYTLLSALRRTAGGAPDLTVETENLSRPIAAIAADGNGAYWAVAGKALYAGMLGGKLTKSDTPPKPSDSETFRGVLHAAPNRLIVSGSAGTLWHSTDAGRTWASPAVKITDEDQAVPLAGMAAAGATILIGTDGFGYYTARFDPDLTVERLPLTTEAIYKSSIRSFMIDPVIVGSSRRVFALTIGHGLWTATVTPGALPDRWQLE